MVSKFMLLRVWIRQRSMQIRGNEIAFMYLPFQVDETNTKEELIQLLQKVRNDCIECEQNLEKSLMANELDAAKSLVITMRYLISLENSIKEKGNRIGVVL